MNRELINKMRVLFLILLFVGFLPGVLYATEYTSDNFQVLDPVLSSGGGEQSTSDSYQLISAVRQLSIGLSESNTYGLKSGFLYWSEPAAAEPEEPVTPTGGGDGIIMTLLRQFVPFMPPALPPEFVACATASDLNCDGKIGLQDLSIFLYLEPESAPNPADFNSDKKVDARDLSILLFNWSEKLVTFVPEGMPIVFKKRSAEEGQVSFEPAAALEMIPEEEAEAPKLNIFEKTGRFIGNIFEKIVDFFKAIFAPLKAEGAGQAALFLNPAAGSFLVGSTMDVSIVLDTKGTAVNTVEAELLFPPDKLQLANPSVGQSIIQLWPAAPLFSNQEGRIYFVGGIPAPGINTSQGVVLTLTFRVAAPGDAEIKFGEKTSVLANDGRGTNILKQKPPAFFTFVVPPPLGPEISSPTHPDQERWYKDINPVFAWPKSKFAAAYSYIIDQDPAGFPDTAAEGTSATASFENLKDGIWYFHLREKAGNPGNWGGVSHYVVKVDNTPPADFKVSVSPGSRTTNRHPIFRFFSTDSLSGFDHFEMKIIPLSQKIISEALFFEVTSPFQAPNLEPGRYQVIVRGLDKAGNSQDKAVTMNIVGALNQFINPDGIDFILFFAPWDILVIAGLILVLIMALALFVLWRKHQRHIKHAFSEDIKNIFKFFRKKPPSKI